MPHLAATALLLAGLLVAPPAGAQESEGWAYDLSSEMMSPFCPGRTLSECPSDQADSLRMWILVQEAAGRSRADVEAELFERYGDAMLAAPRAEGFGLTAYVVPIAVFVAGGLFVAWVLRRWVSSRPGRASFGAPRAADPELERLVDEELSRT